MIGEDVKRVHLTDRKIFVEEDSNPPSKDLLLDDNDTFFDNPNRREDAFRATSIKVNGKKLRTAVCSPIYLRALCVL